MTTSSSSPAANSKCPKCGRPMAAMVICDPYDGEQNVLICERKDYQVGIPQTSMFEVLSFRRRVAAAANTPAMLVAA